MTKRSESRMSLVYTLLTYTMTRPLAFRGYADYMQTSESAEHLADLIVRARRERIVLMCAEAVPWR
jgi:hypothetical protein